MKNFSLKKEWANKALTILLTLVLVLGVFIIANAFNNNITYAEQQQAQYKKYNTSWKYYDSSSLLCTVVTAGETFSDGGNFVVTEDVTINSDITATGSLTIIINPGCTLTINGRFIATDEFNVYKGNTGSTAEAKLVLGANIGQSTLDNFSEDTSATGLGLYYFGYKVTIDGIKLEANAYPYDKATIYIANQSIFCFSNIYVTPTDSRTKYSSFTNNHMIQTNNLVDMYGANITQVNNNIEYSYTHFETGIKTSGSLYLYDKAQIHIYQATIGVEASSVIERGHSSIGVMGDPAVTTRDVCGIKTSAQIYIDSSNVIIQWYKYGLYAANGSISINGFGSDIRVYQPQNDNNSACGIKAASSNIEINSAKVQSTGRGAGGISGNQLEINAASVYGEDLVSHKGFDVNKLVLTDAEIVGKDTASDSYSAITVTDAASDNYTAKSIMKVGLTPVPYREYNSSTKQYDNKEVDYYQIVNDETKFDGSGWYVVNSNVNIDAPVISDQDINLVLVDDCSLTINYNYKSRILNVYGQTKGNGTLTLGADIDDHIDFAMYEFMVLRVDGGVINVNYYPTTVDVICATSSITINGGSFNFASMGEPNAYHEYENCLLHSKGDLTMRGGEISVTGHDYTIANSVICADNNANIEGTINAPSTNYLIQAKDDNDGDAGENIVLNNANITTTGQIFATGSLTITDSDMDLISAVSGSYGLNAGSNITITNSSINIETDNVAVKAGGELIVNSIIDFTAHAITNPAKALSISDVSIPAGYVFYGDNTDGDHYAQINNSDCQSYSYIKILPPYQFDSFVWTGTTAQAKLVSQIDPQDVKFEDAQMSNAVQVAATCEEKGTTRYTATYQDHSEYKDIQDIDALGHNYEFDSFIWSTTYSTAQAKLICANDASHIKYEEIKAVVTYPTPATLTEKGIRRYTVTYGEHSEFKDVEVPIKKPEIEDNGVNAKIDGDEMFDGDIDLVVEVKTEVKAKESEVDYAKVQAKLDKKESIVKVYDVKLIRTVNGVSEEIQPNDIKEGTIITVHMKMPEGFEAGSFRVLHIHSIDDIEEITDFTIEGEDLVFKIDRLSEFAFVAKDASHGFCIGWIVFILVMLELLATALYIIIRFRLLDNVVKKCKIDGLYDRVDLMTLICLCVAGAVFLFALIVLCLHQCIITIISFILATLLCLAFTYFFLKDRKTVKDVKEEQEQEENKEESQE